MQPFEDHLLIIARMFLENKIDQIQMSNKFAVYLNI